MKLKTFFTAFALSSLLVAGSLFAVESGKQQGVKKADATDEVVVGSVTIDSVRNLASNSKQLYLIPTDDVDDLPSDWDLAYSPVGDEDGVFVNGVKDASAIVKHADIGIAFVPFFIETTASASVGDVVEFVGEFTATKDDTKYTFTVELFARQWTGDESKWDYALEDYDVISLKDANLPDYENVAINTEDPSGYGYIGYDESGYAKKYLPKNHGVFGFTNQTGSYNFQFNFEITGTGVTSTWFEIRIGATGGWDSGHFLKFQFTNQEWTPGTPNPGTLIVKEFLGDAQKKSQEVSTNISGGGEMLIEMGSIRVKGYINKYYVFFKVDGVTSFGQYWDLVDGLRSTKIGIYSPNTNIKVSNSVEPVATKLTLSNDSTASALYFNTATDVLPFINSWTEYWFVPQDSTSYTYNGVDASNEKWNYFKKVGATTNSLFFFFPDQGITPTSGDVFHLGGIFKLVNYVNNVSMVYKLVVEDCDFQFDGTAWHAYNPDYTAALFAKDLLKMTLSVCTGAGGNNHDALEDIWETLADTDHFAALSIAEKNLVKNADADPDLPAPTSVAEVDALDNDDALAIAMYRYDYCTAKYNLSAFVGGRTLTVSFASNNIWNITSSNNTAILVIIVAATAMILVAGVVVLHRRKEDR